tara:strand:- start:4659 stop:10388 length:5730 start_codon:yes stop_codon:yes gene_type:complete
MSIDIKKYELQLGDIIELDAPSNPDLHNKTFYINFINKEKILLLSEEKIITLSFDEEGKLLEESIENILLLHREKSASFIVQNNLKINTNISIYFGEPNPNIINALITNIEKDMIELTLQGSDDIIYIDFAYSGIPENLNIDKIVIRDEKINTILDDEETLSKEPIDVEDGSKMIEEDDDLDKKASIIFDKKMDNDLKFNNIVDTDLYEKNVGNILDLEIEEEYEEIFFNVNVPDSEKRYGLEEQISNYLDTMLASNYSIERVNREVNRYIELRNLYSDFDENMYPKLPKKTNEFYKPIIEKIINLEKKIKWIIPVVKNKKTLMKKDDEFEYNNDDFILFNDFVEQAVSVVDNWTKQNKVNIVDSYKKYITKLLDIFNNNIENNNTLSANTQIEVINVIYDNFYSLVTYKNEFTKKRFDFTVFYEGLNMLYSEIDDNKKIKYNKTKLTPSDKLSIISFLTLPLPFLNFSKINCNYTSIYEKANLNCNYIPYFLALNNNSEINSYILEEKDIDKYKNTNDNINDDEKFDNINSFTLENISQETDNNNYKNNIQSLLESFIPTNSKYIKKISKYYNFTNYKNLINYLEIMFIDYNNLHYKDANIIKTIIDNNIQKYIKDYKENEKVLQKYINDKNLNIEDANIKYFINILNRDLIDDLINSYKLNNFSFNNNYELINFIISIDCGDFFYALLNKNINQLIISTLMTNYIEYNKKEKKKQTKKDDECEKYFISKKYISLEDLEYDNNKTIYFDTIYDNTLYTFLNEYENEKQNMNSKNFEKFAIEKIVDKMNITNDKAKREFKAIIEQKREIIDGDYCILYDKDKNINTIFIRKNNEWLIDEKFKDNFYIDTNKIFCDINKECTSINEKCLTKENASKLNLNLNIDEILKNFKNDYNIEIEDLKEDINKNYESTKNHLKKHFLINENKINIHNKLLNELNKINNIKEIVISPYEKLKNKIVNFKDFPLKQKYIKQFCENFTREAINEENNFWFYCKKTNTKLIPTFLLKLANCFLENRNYQSELDTICALQGNISDDGNYWIDKYSGYIIKNIEFNNDEGFDEQGHKLITKEILEEENDIKFEQNGEIISYDVKIINGILKTMTQLIGINLSNYFQEIASQVIDIQKKIIPKKEIYDKMMEKNKMKDSKFKVITYDDFYNSSLLLLTLSFLIIYIQISIPSLKTKKTFPGCIKSFSGYPFEGDQDKSTMIYIVCIAHKIKSSIKPWNTLLKQSEANVIKKIEALIEKYIITNKKIQLLISKKQKYLLSSKDNDDIPEKISINNWYTFLPPLNNIKIDNANLQVLDNNFENNIIKTLKSGTNENFIDIIKNKIVFLSLNIIEHIQDIVKNETLLMENKSGIPFLENACCNSEKNNILYFITKNNKIYDNNLISYNYNIIIKKIYNLISCPILFHYKSTRKNIIKIEKAFNEEIIYKTFIYYGNFENTIPLSEDLKLICGNKPKSFKSNDLISEKINKLKELGKIYNLKDFEELIKYISKRNLLENTYNDKILSNNELLVILVKDYIETVGDDDNIDPVFFYKFDKLLDNFDILNDENKELREIKNYLAKTNDLMKTNIINYFSKETNLSKKDLDIIKTNLDIQVNIDNIQSFTNIIYDIVNIIPYIIINKSLDTEYIPEYLKKILSDKHTKDIKNILDSYYLEFFNYEYVEEMKIINNIIKNKTNILLKILYLFKFKNDINFTYNNSEQNIKNIFDKRFIELFYSYVYYSILNEYINIDKNPIFKLDINSLEKYKYDNETINNMKSTILKILINYTYEKNILLSNNHKKIKEKITYAKEKEKEGITDYLKNLNIEEREIENIFKNNKLEKWNKGLQKGLTQYVKENYDEERDEMEAKMIKDKKLNKNNLVNDMNKEIFKLDMEHEEYTTNAINEEYDIASIPDEENAEDEYDF